MTAAQNSRHSRSAQPRVLALCGGIGGAKLALGLYHELGGERLTVVVNTGDDFEHLGLHISPDIDTVLYTLAGVADAERGWGRAGETWNFMAAVGEMGGETWFSLGDRDLAVHVERTRRLNAGETLTAVTADLVQRFGVSARIAPMSDDRVRTIVHTADGPLAFQHYFVRERCAPKVARISFDGAATASPAPAFTEALADPALAAIVVCPSNPYLSVDPILAVPGIRAALAATSVPVVAVSPVIGGAAVKGPTAKIMGELGVAVTSKTVVEHYHDVIDGLVIDDADADDAGRVGIRCAVTRTLMKSLEDRRSLARDVLAFAERLARERETA